jgi:hypothetical protein
VTSAIAKVTSANARHVTSAKASDVTSAEVTSAEASDVTSAEAADMAAAKAAAYMAAATATSVSTASATASAGLRISGKKAAGKHCTCQNHHHSSSHENLLWNGRDFPPQGLVRCWRVRGKQTPTSRWTEDEDADLSFLLNSRSINPN